MMQRSLLVAALVATANASDCEKISSQSACASSDCSWCSSGAVGDSCMSKEDAGALPSSVFTCDLGSYKFLGSTTCDKITSQDSCASSDCIWCESGAVGASCNTKEDAAALPSSIFTCDSAISAGEESINYYFLSDSSCNSITSQSACDNASCVWCESGAVGASCNTKEDAAALPASIFTCDNSVTATVSAVAAPQEVMIKHGDHEAIRANPVKSSQYNMTVSATLESYQSDPLGYTTLYHSEVAYCGTDAGDPSYMERDYSTNQYTNTFECSAYIHSDNSKESIRGYVGVQPNVKAIIVSFRGSEDLNNWITNLDAFRTTYNKCDGCSVHSGFLSAAQGVYSQVFDAVSNLNSKYPDYEIAVTGHSLGAALATLTALDLIDSFGSKVVMYNYGCPRLFNDKAADWASSGVLRIGARRTHYKDIVPHSPPYISGYRHTSGEIYEGGPSSDYPNFPGGPLKVCQGEESDQCADQWDIGSISDHLLYSGVVMGTGGCSAL